MMKNIIVILTLLVLMTGMVNAIKPVCSHEGSIWTTDINGGVQDKNQYNVGEGIYLNAKDFASNTSCTWTIDALGNQPHVTIANGTVSTDSNGALSAYYLYTTKQSEAGNGKVFHVTLECGPCKAEKHDNYKVNDFQVPEFGTAAALVALIGSVGIFMLVRKRQ